MCCCWPQKQNLIYTFRLDNRLKSLSISYFEQINDIFNIYVSSLLVFIGIIGNLISIFVFVRSVRHSPKILTRNSLILLTLSNLMYLMLVWYYQVLKRFYDRLYLVNSHVVVCKSVIYSINLAITLNALITVSIVQAFCFEVFFCKIR